MGDAGVCRDCGGSGTVWTGSARIPCRRCKGAGVRQPRLTEDPQWH